MAAEIFPASVEFVPFDTRVGRERYIACYEDAWRIAHGSLAGVCADTAWYAALQRASDDPASLTELRVGEEFAGVLCLDEKRGQFRRLGWIAFCYIVPERRGQGLGRTMLDYAAAHFRARGRKAMCLTVAPGNPALGFYRQIGFSCVGTEPGALEDLYVMERKL